MRKVDKDGNDNIITISYKTKFVDNTGSLSNLVDNLAEGIYETKCKDCSCLFECKSVKDIIIKYECLF